MSPDEAILLFGQCPDCEKADLHMGPTGGASTNFACFSCRARFNGVFGPTTIHFFERCGKLTDADKSVFHPNRFHGLVEIWRG